MNIYFEWKIIFITYQNTSEYASKFSAQYSKSIAPITSVLLYLYTTVEVKCKCDPWTEKSVYVNVKT